MGRHLMLMKIYIQLFSIFSRKIWIILHHLNGVNPYDWEEIDSDGFEKLPILDGQKVMSIDYLEKIQERCPNVEDFGCQLFGIKYHHPADGLLGPAIEWDEENDVPPISQAGSATPGLVSVWWDPYP
jgi:hypothetical protein